MIKAKIVNVVATASLNQDLDFDELRKHREIFHDSDVYGGRVAYFKTPKMEGRVSIFPSGKMISVGTKSENQANKELEFAMKFIAEKGYANNVPLQPKTQNIVVTAELNSSLELETLNENLKAIYEPEQFPGAILRITNPIKASILLFASGKIVIAGLTSTNQIEPVLKHLEKTLKPT